MKIAIITDRYYRGMLNYWNINTIYTYTSRGKILYSVGERRKKRKGRLRCLYAYVKLLLKIK